jgi:hypothetical protein
MEIQSSCSSRRDNARLKPQHVNECNYLAHSVQTDTAATRATNPNFPPPRGTKNHALCFAQVPELLIGKSRDTIGNMYRVEPMMGDAEPLGCPWRKNGA